MEKYIVVTNNAYKASELAGEKVTEPGLYAIKPVKEPDLKDTSEKLLLYYLIRNGRLLGIRLYLKVLNVAGEYVIFDAPVDIAKKYLGLKSDDTISIGNDEVACSGELSLSYETGGMYVTEQELQGTVSPLALDEDTPMLHFVSDLLRNHMLLGVGVAEKSCNLSKMIRKELLEAYQRITGIDIENCCVIAQYDKSGVANRYKIEELQLW